MPNVTVLGASGGIVSIPVTSAAGQRAGQSALATANAAVAARTMTPITFGGTVPSGSGSSLLMVGNGQQVTVPASANVAAIVASGSAPVSVTTATAAPVTVVSGQGGLTFTQTISAPGSMIVTGGGANTITLAAGATTLSLDVSPSATVNGVAVGTSTVNALAGGATIEVNASANDGGHADSALILAAGGDTVAVAGDATGDAVAAIGLDDATVQVQLGNDAAAFLAGATVVVSTTAGDETVGVLTGSTEWLTGAASGGGMLAVAAGTALAGNLLINPRSQNVTVFAGAGATTLFGAGDGSAANTGRDFIAGGQGYFRLGTAGGSVGESAANLSTAQATTLIGGGAGDALYAQSGNVSLRGAYGTTLLWAAGGVSVNGFSVAAAASGDTIDAGGAVGATIAGAVSGGNTIISGSGSAEVFGNHGAQGGNFYLDGAAGGAMTIMDFNALDTFHLTGTQQVAGVSGSLVTLTDGTRITIADGFVGASNVGQYFHG